jgi:hypothetical protein
VGPREATFATKDRILYGAGVDDGAGHRLRLGV